MILWKVCYYGYLLSSSISSSNDCGNKQTNRNENKQEIIHKEETFQDLLIWLPCRVVLVRREIYPRVISIFSLVKLLSHFFLSHGSLFRVSWTFYRVCSLCPSDENDRPLSSFSLVASSNNVAIEPGPCICMNWSQATKCRAASNRCRGNKKTKYVIVWIPFLCRQSFLTCLSFRYKDKHNI